jgi:hypothetical protein
MLIYVNNYGYMGMLICIYVLLLSPFGCFLLSHEDQNCENYMQYKYSIFSINSRSASEAVHKSTSL